VPDIYTVSNRYSDDVLSDRRLNFNWFLIPPPTKITELTEFLLQNNLLMSGFLSTQDNSFVDFPKLVSREFSPLPHKVDTRIQKKIFSYALHHHCIPHSLVANY